MTRLHRGKPQAFTPMLTPFRNGQVDLQELASAIERQVVAAMDGIIVSDAVGEGYALTSQEREAILALSVECAGRHLSVIAATGTNCTRTTIEFCQSAEKGGADALLVTLPYYSKPTLDGVVDHFRQVAASVSIPVIVDDDPKRTAKDYGPQLLERIAAFDIVTGVCHGYGRCGHFAQLQDHLKQRFLHISRDSQSIPAFLALGGDGIVSALANVAPSPVQTMIATEGHVSNRSSSLSQTVTTAATIFCSDDVAALKTAACFVHQMPSDVRLPLVDVDSEAKGPIERAVAAFGKSTNHTAAA